MYVNKYLLIVLGFILEVLIMIFINIFSGVLFGVVFWYWYNNKKTYTKEEIRGEEMEKDV